MPQAALVDSLKKLTALRLGAEVRIRAIGPEDIDAAYLFFSRMPKEDRNYLRFDVTRKSEIENRIRAIATRDDVHRLVAFVDNRIAATGVLEMQSEHWKRHVAEMRLIVGRAHRRKGLGKLMARELFLLGLREKAEEIVVQLMRPQVAAYNIVKGLGFREEAVLSGYVRDMEGRRQDLIIMHCDLKTLWRELEHQVAELDWQRHR